MKKKFIVVIAVLIAVLAGCASMTVVGIDDSSVAGPKQVRQYGDINPRDITIYAFYKDDSRKPYTVRSGDISFDNSRAGRQTVTVKVSGGFTATFETEVMALTGITIASQPSAVKLGASSSWSGLEIQGAWDQMGSEKIDTSKCQITGFNANSEGRQTVTVSYNGKQATFSVNVVAMQSIRITSNPAKVTYYQGEPLNLTGLKVVGVYGSGIPDEDLTIAASNVTGFNTQTLGRQTLTIARNNRTTTFSVEVVPVTVSILNGTWAREDDYGENGKTRDEYTFNNGTFVWRRTGNLIEAGTKELRQVNYRVNGTYTVSGYKGKVTFTVTSGDYSSMPTWNEFSIDIDPRVGNLQQIVRGTVVWGTTDQNMWYWYIKQ